MKRRNILAVCALFLCSLLVTVSCAPSTETPQNGPPVVIGYSSWAGWWPWKIAEVEGLFEKNGANVELKWFDEYTKSMEALASGNLDGNAQTLGDTISFADSAINGEVVVLVNDNSAGNDKIIVAEDINTVADLKGKTVAVEEGVVDDFLLTLALEREGLKREDVKIKGLPTDAAATAFAAGQADAVGAFPPFWSIALKREGSKELISSKEFPGAIPDLLVVTQKLIDERPDQVQALVDTWWDIRKFMEENPQKSDEIMAALASVPIEEFQQYKEGTRFLTLEENLQAFEEGNNMIHMPFAARRITRFMLDVQFIKEQPPLVKLFNDSFVKAAAEKAKS